MTRFVSLKKEQNLSHHLRLDYSLGWEDWSSIGCGGHVQTLAVCNPCARGARECLPVCGSRSSRPPRACKHAPVMT